MKRRNSRFQLGRVWGATYRCLVMLTSSPSEPRPDDDEPNRRGSQSFIDEELNHRRRKNDLGAGGDDRNRRCPNGSAGDDQSISQR